MSLPYSSVATIKDIEFVNLEPSDISPLISKCEIKVFYLGKNRNGSFIDKEVATNMAKTLRGNPIVGVYKKDKEDFGDHGEEVVINGDGIKFNCLTKPYGFVSPDSKVWFKEFEETDAFGNKILREYLMTTGYIWDGQYEEAKSIIEEGKPHSMELDNKTLDGKWATDFKEGIEFFIINDAIFSKLCILGDDVEPCFEGSSITAPEISKNFSMDDKEFKRSLYNMMQQLKFALEGGKQPMENNDINATVVEPTVNTEFAQTDDDKKKQEDAKKTETPDNKEDDKKKKEEEENNRYALLEEKFSLLEEKYTNLEKDYKELVSFKSNTEEKEKDELIKKFYMLSDEDKKDVIENKAKYSLEEIESKLSVVCFRKKVNFDLDDNTETNNTVEEQPTVTFNLNNQSESSLPAWLEAAKKTRDSKNN